MTILRCGLWSIVAILVGCGAPPPDTRVPVVAVTPVTAAQDPERVSHAVSPPIETPSMRVLRLVDEATSRCQAVDLPADLFLVSGERVVARPVALCAWSERHQRWHTVIVRIPFLSKADWSRPKEWREAHFVIDVLTPGYRVSRVADSGFGPSRLAFHVWLGDEYLQVFRVRHVWFERSAFMSNVASRMLATYTLIDLTPMHPDFLGVGLEEVGMTWLLDEVSAIYDELDLHRVTSSAFSGVALTSVIPKTLLFSIPIIEHIDQETYMGTTHCGKEPSCVAAAQQRAIESAIIVYALNKGKGNRFSVSASGAVGAWQFMNSPKNPTYDAVRRNCAAGIDPTYPEGAQEFRNAGKAAACLLDLNLGYLPETHHLFRRNPVLGGIYLLAAYNGGPKSAKALFRAVHQKHPDVEAQDIVLPSVLQLSKGSVKKTVRTGGRKRSSYVTLAARLNGETPGYAHKFLTLLEYLAQRDVLRE